MEKNNTLNEFIEQNIREKTLFRKKDLVQLIISEFDSEKISSEETITNKIEKWIKGKPIGYKNLKASDFERKFNFDIPVGIGVKVNGNEMIYYYENAFDKNRILYAKKLIDEKKRLDLAHNIILNSKSLNINELYELFNFLNPEYPIQFIKTVTDTLLVNLKAQELKIKDTKKEELIKIVNLFYVNNYQPLDIYIKECPYKIERNRLNSEIHQLMQKNNSNVMFHSDSSKNTPIQNKVWELEKKIEYLSNKIEEYEKEVELKKSIRSTLIEIISLFNDKNKVYDYFIADVDQYIIYIKKIIRNSEELKKLCDTKGIKPPFDIMLSSGDIQIDKLYRKNYNLRYDSTKLFTVICFCYSQGITNLLLNLPEYNKAKLIYDYENFEEIQQIINIVFR